MADALLESKRWINSNKQSAKLFAKLNYWTTSSVIEKSWDNIDFMIRYDEGAKADLGDSINLMRKNGWFDKDDFESFFYKS